MTAFNPTPRRALLTTVMAAGMFLAATITAAGEPQQHQLVVVGDDGEHVTVTLDGSALEIVSIVDGEVDVVAFDFSLLESVIDDALENVIAEFKDGPQWSSDPDPDNLSNDELRREIRALEVEIEELRVELDRR